MLNKNINKWQFLEYFCFTRTMEVVVKENIANRPMHNEPYVAGILDAPDSHYQPVLYSHWQATKDFNRLDQDIYEKKSKSKAADSKKTPKSVLWGLGAAGVFVLFRTLKHVFKK